MDVSADVGLSWSVLIAGLLGILLSTTRVWVEYKSAGYAGVIPANSPELRPLYICGMDEKFIMQFRSWEIMREYFGIEQTGSVYTPIEFPAHLEEGLEKIRKKYIEYEKKRIQLN